MFNPNRILRIQKLKKLAIEFFPSNTTLHDKINKLAINLLINPSDECIDQQDEIIKSLRVCFARDFQMKFHSTHCLPCSKHYQKIDRLLMLESLLNHSNLSVINLYHRLLILLFLDGEDINEVEAELFAKIT